MAIHCTRWLSDDLRCTQRKMRFYDDAMVWLAREESSRAPETDIFSALQTNRTDAFIPKTAGNFFVLKYSPKDQKRDIISRVYFIVGFWIKYSKRHAPIQSRSFEPFTSFKRCLSINTLLRITCIFSLHHKSVVLSTKTPHQSLQTHEKMIFFRARGFLWRATENGESLGKRNHHQYNREGIQNSPPGKWSAQRITHR